MAQVTISDEEYSQMLEARLEAKHQFEAGEGTWEAYQATRAVVRRARKVRRTEGAVVENYRQQSLPQHQAMTRKVLVEEPQDQTPVTLIMVPERRVKAQVTPAPEPQAEPEVVAKPVTRRTRKAKVA